MGTYNSCVNIYSWGGGGYYERRVGNAYSIRVLELCIELIKW